MRSLLISLGVLAFLAFLGAWVTTARAADQPAPALPAGYLAQKKTGELRAHCQNNLKQLGLVFKMFANESKGGRFPSLSAQPGCLMFANEEDGASPVYPEYLADLNVLICPASSAASFLKGPTKKPDPKVMIDDHSYFYLGYAVTNEADVKAFANAYKERMAKGLKMDEDIKTPNGQLYLLREGIERFYITDINDPAGAAEVQAHIPILIERLGNHEPAGGNVLYSDGHCEFIREGTWPMTKDTIEALKELDTLKPSAKP
ncbi:MAG TPA: hypothetical protein VMZ06_18115 [Candidatus Bathyarchaeia archaeon]|nr:hypothetical protein [Candidatus Bathyarchaeia archaeon]